MLFRRDVYDEKDVALFRDICKEPWPWVGLCRVLLMHYHTRLSLALSLRLRSKDGRPILAIQ